MGVPPGPAAAAGDVGTNMTMAAGGVPAWIIQLALGLFSSMEFDGDKGDWWKDPNLASDSRGLQAALINMGIRPRYQSKNIKGLDEMITKLLSGQMGRSGNWGYPGGSQQMDLSFIMDFLNKMGQPKNRQLIGDPNPTPPGDTIDFSSLSPRRRLG